MNSTGFQAALNGFLVRWCEIRSFFGFHFWDESEHVPRIAYTVGLPNENSILTPGFIRQRCRIRLEVAQWLRLWQPGRISALALPSRGMAGIRRKGVQLNKTFSLLFAYSAKIPGHAFSLHWRNNLWQLWSLYNMWQFTTQVRIPVSPEHELLIRSPNEADIRKFLMPVSSGNARPN
ncbi:hypothetical protein CSKR_101616 [Clonorchis sinensis]|uniref:Uncharacterized protein n=1 Tax=Clonorchis sinensis TaxID=79923 RepID=A0A419Q6E3_CLOSI|nr:hypothetical protein CSKR_101616 [Clonorchis sinensis]